MIVLPLLSFTRKMNRSICTGWKIKKTFYLVPLFQNKHLLEIQRHAGNTEARFQTSTDILSTALCIYFSLRS